METRGGANKKDRHVSVFFDLDNYTLWGYTEYMGNESRAKLRSRVNRAQGQVAAVGRMLDEGAYCVDILTQIAAARSALDAIGVELLADHLETCVAGHGTDTEHECAKPLTQTELVEEVRTVVRRFLR